MRTNRPHLRATIALILIPLAWAGCHHQTQPAPSQPGPYLPQDSPANCLANLRTAYVDRDSTQYNRLFSSDFVFVFAEFGFDPLDPHPAQWGRADERTAAAHLFASDSVGTIALSWTLSDAVDSGTEYVDTWKVLASAVNLRVDVEQSGTARSYRTEGAYAAFYFKSYPSEQAANGRPLWRVWRWKDQPIRFPGSAPADTTIREAEWGAIKFHFR